MGVASFGPIQPQTRTPRLTIRSEYPDSSTDPTCVTFGLSSDYGIHTASEAHDWFLRMMREHEEFGVETDEAGEEAMPFWSDTIRDVFVVYERTWPHHLTHKYQGFPHSADTRRSA